MALKLDDHFWQVVTLFVASFIWGFGAYKAHTARLYSENYKASQRKNDEDAYKQFWAFSAASAFFFGAAIWCIRHWHMI